MILFESILDGIRDIRDHFGRTMLQLLGIILGAASIVATFSLSVAGKAASMEYYRVSGGIQKIWIWNKDTGKISPVSSKNMTVRYRSIEKPREIMGIVPAFGPMNDVHVAKGRFISDSDVAG